MSTGRLIAASLGPGDPGLITRASWEALRASPCWAWPESRQEGGGYALAIAQRAELRPPARTLPLAFPMTRDPGVLARHWREAAASVLAVLRQGLDVVFLVEGDASFFSTFGHLQRTVLKMDPAIGVEILPGVASPLAAAALDGRGLCDGDQSVAMVPATIGMDRIARLLDEFESVTLLKVRPVLDEVLALLEARGLLDKAVFVERAGAPEQRIVREVRTLKGAQVHYLSLLIIHCNDGEFALGGRP